jgi:hypothetical protein
MIVENFSEIVDFLTAETSAFDKKKSPAKAGDLLAVIQAFRLFAI